MSSNEEQVTPKADAELDEQALESVAGGDNWLTDAIDGAVIIYDAVVEKLRESLPSSIT